MYLHLILLIISIRPYSLEIVTQIITFWYLNVNIVDGNWLTNVYSLDSGIILFLLSKYTISTFQAIFLKQIWSMDDAESRDAYALLLLESIIRMYCSLKLVVKRFDIRKTRRLFNKLLFHFKVRIKWSLVLLRMWYQNITSHFINGSPVLCI